MSRGVGITFWDPGGVVLGHLNAGFEVKKRARGWRARAALTKKDKLMKMKN